MNVVVRAADSQRLCRIRACDAADVRPQVGLETRRNAMHAVLRRENVMNVRGNVGVRLNAE